jgi:hypothetical protein
MQKIFKITYNNKDYYLKADDEQHALNAFKANLNLTDEEVKITSKLSIKKKQELLDNPSKFFLQVLSEQYKNKTKEQLVEEFFKTHSLMFSKKQPIDFDITFQRMVNEMKQKGLEDYVVKEDIYLSDLVYALETNKKW